MQTGHATDGALDREEVRRARSASPEQRFRGGPELFEMACQWAEAGLRSQHPSASRQELRALLEHRLQVARRLEAAR